MSSRPPPPAELLRWQRSLNRNSAAQGEAFADHRAQVMALLASTEGELALLGAGNCNDVDLPALVARHGQVHLLDLDDEALRRTVGRQPPEVAARLVVHPPIDLSGAMDLLTPAAATAAFRRDPPAREDRIRAAVGRTFDTVVSACLLTQIVQSCRRGLGLEHPHLTDAADLLLTAHMRALLLLTRPGGSAVLMTDTVSSETYPLDELYDPATATALLDELERSDNLLTGTEPRTLRRFLTRDPVAAPLLAGPPRVVPPWLWHLGGDVTLLTYALVIRRSDREAFRENDSSPVAT